MFFFLSKVLGFFALPSNLIISLGILGALLLATRHARAGWRLVVASLLLLAIFGFSPVGNAMMLPLEQRFPPWDASRGVPAGIIVLGGALSPRVSAARGVVVLNEAAERLTVAVELARRYPQARVVYSSGNGSLVHADAEETRHALRQFEDLGLARTRILLEDRSRNTAENALFSKQLIKPKPGERWLLITSAYHMPRAVACFRRVGFAVEPYPVDWRTRGPDDLTEPFGSLADGLKRADTAAKEYVGLFAYWLTGRTSELWPEP
jgi:uncharacterized SAM-binding protein YcdF (DUF218 family)